MSAVVNLKDLVDAQAGLLRRPSLAEDTAQTLRGMILLEKLPPGTALPERDLSQALGISRTPLREAIRLLAGEGLIQYTAARRPFVADPSPDEINDCLRVQGALEALTGELACTEASTQQLEEIAQINANIVDTRNDDTRLSAFQADMRFHQSIVKVTKNPPLAETHAKYNARLSRVHFLSSQRAAGCESTRRKHHEIIEALKAHLITAEKNIALALKDRASITEE